MSRTQLRRTAAKVVVATAPIVALVATAGAGIKWG